MLFRYLLPSAIRLLYVSPPSPRAPAIEAHIFTQLTANQAADNYWIRANPAFGNLGFEGGINSAILRYQGAATIEPTTSQQTTQNLLNEADLHPLIPRITVCSTRCKLE